MELAMKGLGFGLHFLTPPAPLGRCHPPFFQFRPWESEKMAIKHKVNESGIFFIIYTNHSRGAE